MKILLAAVGSHGDVRPMIALGLTLRSGGYDVEFCAPPDFSDTIAEFGFPFHPVGSNIRALLEEKGKEARGNQVRGLKLLFECLAGEISRQFSELRNAAEGANFIVGEGLLLAGPSVAQACDLPYRHVSHIPQTLVSPCHPPVALPWQDLPRWANRLGWHVARRITNHTLRRVINRQRKQSGLDAIDDFLQYFTDHTIVAMDAELARVPSDVRSEYYQTGYWHLGTTDRLDPELVDFLRQAPPPVYIGFGSMTELYPGDTTNIIEEAIRIADLRAVLSRGWANLGEDLHAECVRVIGSTPHAELFPAVAAVVHHGGAGTTCTAARAGIPQVIVPYILDQYYWGNRIRQLGLGPSPIPRSKLTAPRLAAAMVKAVSDPDLRENARLMGEKLRRNNGLKEALMLFESWTGA